MWVDGLVHQEGIEGKIELPDDEPEIVRYMMEYLYCLDYTPPALVDADTQSLAESHNSAMLHGIPDGQFFGSSAFEQPASPFGGFMPPDGRRSARRMADRRNPSAAPEPSPLATATPHLVLHAKMYSIADKYGISGLKSLALDKFKIQLTKHWCVPPPLSPSPPRSAFFPSPPILEVHLRPKNLTPALFSQEQRRILRSDSRRLHLDPQLRQGHAQFCGGRVRLA